jgi:transcriptional regulator with XRE-family HTH domain
MSKAPEVLRKRIAALYSDFGRIAEVVRKTGLSRRVLEKWRDGESSPSIENLERLADALGVQPWELIKPDGAQPTKQEVPLPEGVRQAIREELNSRPEPAHPVMARPIEKLMATKGLQAEHMAPAVLNLFALELHELDALVEQINQMVLDKLTPKESKAKKSS